MSHLLVTGADGFVGRWLVRAARADGWDVTAVIGPGGAQPEAWLTADELVGVTAMTADFDSLEAIARVAKVSADAVIHLAAMASGAAARHDPEAAMRINGTASVLLFQQLHERANAPRTLFVSTGEVYGTGHDTPIDEEVIPHPVSPYAESKLCAEDALIEMDEACVFDFMIVRPFPHTGPGQSPTYVLPAFAKRIREAARTGAQEIAVGNLDVVRDFLDVRDVVQAYLQLLEHGVSGSCYNVASGTGRHLGRCVEMLAERMRVAVKPVVDPALVRPADIPVLIGDATRLRSLTGWAPQYTFEQTLQDLVDAQAD